MTEVNIKHYNKDVISLSIAYVKNNLKNLYVSGFSSTEAINYDVTELTISPRGVEQ